MVPNGYSKNVSLSLSLSNLVLGLGDFFPMPSMQYSYQCRGGCKFDSFNGNNNMVIEHCMRTGQVDDECLLN